MSLDSGSDDRRPTKLSQLKTVVFGKPRDIEDPSLFHALSLVPFLAWIGLGADGLSSSSYGPEEAFRSLGQHTYLAIGLVLCTIVTITIISMAYSRIIAHFPTGGGGYNVATKLLGSTPGLISGCALLVDYVLTITTSIAASGDALFSFIPIEYHHYKLTAEVIVIVLLTTLNIRGVKETVVPLIPIFLIFIVSHAVLIFGGILMHAGEFSHTIERSREGFNAGLSTLGLFGMLKLFARAYSLGGGTYTGLEAVSNGLVLMREPRVQTAQRTMIYMATSLAITAGGLLLTYLLWDVASVEGQTLNAVLSKEVFSRFPGGGTIALITLISEGALLIIAAQAGFLDGPRVLANMAVDGWVPRKFAALSDRLTSQNGIVLMGAAACAALLYTHGKVQSLVVMYSINVFVTFSLSMLGMLRYELQEKKAGRFNPLETVLFFVGFILCFSILIVTAIEKFAEGGWITLVVTSALVALCYVIKQHYRSVAQRVSQLHTREKELLADKSRYTSAPVDPSLPTTVIMVGGYSALGIITLQNVLEKFPEHARNIIFVGVGEVDSGMFKGHVEMESLKASTQSNLEKYVNLARHMGIPAEARFDISMDAVDEIEQICRKLAKDHTRITFFAGQIISSSGGWFYTLLHNQTAYAVQKSLQLDGHTMVILPVKVN